MIIFDLLLLLAGSMLGITWLILEFKGSQRLRIICGLLALITLTLVASRATLFLNQLNYNYWYGFASKGLIDETIRGIEAGKSEMVLRELKMLQNKYRPTYENRAKYVLLVKETTEQMKKDNPPNK